MPENIEVELKLKLADSGEYERLIVDTDIFKISELGEARVEEYETTYFDTSGHELGKEGLTYRIRKAKDSYTATIKDYGSNEGGLHVRNEWNRVIPDEKPDIKPFSDLEIASKLKELIGEKSLEPVFETRFKRHILNFHAEDGSIIEVGADSGEIISGDKSEPICEIELELKGGQVTELLKLGSRLSEQYPLVLEEKSKYQRGIMLAAFHTEIGEQTGKLELHKNKKTKNEIEKTLVFCLMQIIKTQELFIKEPGNIEVVHAFRISIRRFRSLMSFVKPVLKLEEYLAVQEKMRSLEQKFSYIRQLDVLIEECNGIVKKNKDQFSSETVLGGALKTARGAEQAQVSHIVSIGTATPDILSVWAWLMEKPLENNADAEVPLESFTEKRLGNWLKRIQNDLENVGEYDNAAFHAFRIRCKKLRYALDMIAPVLDNKYKKLLADSKELQELLGNIFDTGRNISEVKKLLSNQSDLSLHFEAGAFTGYQLSKAEVLLRVLKEYKFDY